VPAFSRAQISRLLESLNAELKKAGVKGDVYLAGGAVMCLAFEARDSTKDVDAVFRPSDEIRQAALRVAAKEGVPDNWLNDAVKSYVSDHGTFDRFRELSNLRVFCADARYMLAMKCLAMRMGEGFQDENDIRYLLKNLGIERYEDALEIIGKYYSTSEFPKTALAALRELTQDSS
jgi:hypothetical protein